MPRCSARLDRAWTSTWGCDRGGLRGHDYERLIAVGRTICEHDAKLLLHAKQVLEDLEDAIDKFEVVAERLKNSAVKNG